MVDQQERAEHILREIVTQQEQAWNGGDASAWASVFTDDARFVTLRGDVFAGRETIEQRHRMIFSTFYKGSRDKMTIESLTFPAEGVAVLDVLHEVRNYASLPPGITPTEPGVLLARMKYVAVRRGASWLFTSAQNTSVFPKPDVRAQ